MTLATLNFIHDTLKREEEVSRRAKKLAYQVRADADDDSTALKAAAEEAYESWREANNALRDFEAQEW